jgi:hypothetical protein
MKDGQIAPKIMILALADRARPSISTKKYLM